MNAEYDFRAQGHGVGVVCSSGEDLHASARINQSGVEKCRATLSRRRERPSQRLPLEFTIANAVAGTVKKNVAPMPGSAWAQIVP